MNFLIDENLPISVGEIFIELGFSVQCIVAIKELRGASDEVVFNYAVMHGMIVVTRDLGFANLARFDLEKAAGIIIIRFPNSISITKLCDEMRRLLHGLRHKDFKQLIIFEPGIVRMRPLI